MSGKKLNSPERLASHEYVGKPVLRAEDLELLRGRGGFLADLPAPGAAEICILRSTEPHALVRAILTARALASPGVIAILTANDLDLADGALPCVDMIPGTLDVRHRVIARERVRYVGQAVESSGGGGEVSLPRTEDAAALVEIDYQSLPAVTDHMAAKNPGAPLLYPELGTNIVYQVTQRDGNADFTAADGYLVIRKLYEFNRQTGGSWLEPLRSHGSGPG